MSASARRDPVPAAPPVAGALRELRPLKDDGFAETRLVEHAGRPWVHKRYRFRFPGGGLLAPLARACMRRELATCRALEGVEGIPWRAQPVDRDSFLREWVEGRDLLAHERAGGRLADDFFERLAATLTEVHARGVAIVDLAKRDNVIVGTDGRPWIIDYQLSLRDRPGRRGLLAALSRRVVEQAQRDDWRHLYKAKRALRPDLLTDEELARSRARSPLGRLHALIWTPLRPVKRWFFPKGSNDRFRFSRRR